MLDTVDQVLKTLVEGRIGFDVPDHLRLGRTQTVQVRVRVKVPAEQLVRELRAGGQVGAAPLKVAPQMQATLSGTGFDVAPSGPQLKRVGNDVVTQWQWDVTPKTEGRHELTLAFDALLEVGGQEATQTVATVSRPILVEADWTDTVGQWVDGVKNWVSHGGWVWPAVLVPLAGAVVGLRKRYLAGRAERGRTL